MIKTITLWAAMIAIAVGVSGAATGRQKKRSASPIDNIAAGKMVFEKNCLTCHGPGIGNPGNAYKPGTDALRVKYDGEQSGLLTERKDLTPELVEYFVRNGVSTMAFFRKTEISDQDMKNLGAYLSRNNPDLKK